MVSERKRREAAYEQSVEAVLAYIDGEDADLFNLLDDASRTDALGASYRLTFLAARSVEALAAATDETPAAILNRLVRETHR